HKDSSGHPALQRSKHCDGQRVRRVVVRRSDLRERDCRHSQSTSTSASVGARVFEKIPGRVRSCSQPNGDYFQKDASKRSRHEEDREIQPVLQIAFVMYFGAGREPPLIGGSTSASLPSEECGIGLTRFWERRV